MNEQRGANRTKIIYNHARELARMFSTASLVTPQKICSQWLQVHCEMWRFTTHFSHNFILISHFSAFAYNSMIFLSKCGHNCYFVFPLFKNISIYKKIHDLSFDRTLWNLQETLEVTSIRGHLPIYFNRSTPKAASVLVCPWVWGID